MTDSDGGGSARSADDARQPARSRPLEAPRGESAASPTSPPGGTRVDWWGELLGPIVWVGGGLLLWFVLGSCVAALVD